MRVSGLASVDERLINNGFVMLWEEVEGWRRKGGGLLYHGYSSLIRRWLRGRVFFFFLFSMRDNGASST